MSCERREGSPKLRSLQDIKHEIRAEVTYSIGDGAGTLFWLDPWLGDRPLRVDFPQLFAICADPMLLVAIAGHRLWEIPFRRSFGPDENIAWEDLRARLPPSLTTSPDSISWLLCSSGIFTVRSTYRALCRGPSLTWTSPLWKAPIPLKTKIFVWQLLRDRLPSGVEVVKRHGPGNGLCPLCAVPETTHHIMFACPAARFLWSFVSEALDLSGRP
jgi:hypothetical protein